jgi:acetyl/propionyl-CoA carboxylase alpha subunit
MKYITSTKDQEFEIEILDEHKIAIDGEIHEINFESISGQPVFSLLIDSKSYDAYVYEGDDGWEVLLRGELYRTQVVDEREQRLRAAFENGLAQSSEFFLKAPMPGLVIDVLVRDGQEVKKGDVLMVLESMKMQNELKSPQAGVVSRVRVEVGDHVERRQTLLSVM